MSRLYTFWSRAWGIVSFRVSENTTNRRLPITWHKSRTCSARTSEFSEEARLRGDEKGFEVLREEQTTRRKRETQRPGPVPQPSTRAPLPAHMYTSNTRSAAKKAPAVPSGGLCRSF